MTPMEPSQTSAPAWKTALRAAFPHTIPILTGFGFLGITYGVLMKVSGFPFWYPLLISLTVFAGSMQFVAVSLLLAPFAPVSVLVLTLMLGARHLFYGIAMLDKYRDAGWKKPLLIFWMCDETFSINCAARVPDGVDRDWFYFFVSLLDYSYWVVASALGGVFGALIPFDTQGLDFVMTAMFVVIFLEQWLGEKDHTCSLLGLGLPLLCLLLFGEDGFIIPAMAAILLALTLLRGSLERGGREL